MQKSIRGIVRIQWYEIKLVPLKNNPHPRLSAASDLCSKTKICRLFNKQLIYIYIYILYLFTYIYYTYVHIYVHIYIYVYVYITTLYVFFKMFHIKIKCRYMSSYMSPWNILKWLARKLLQMLHRHLSVR